MISPATDNAPDQPSATEADAASGASFSPLQARLLGTAGTEEARRAAAGNGERGRRRRVLALTIASLLATVALIVGATLWFMEYHSHGRYIEDTNDAMVDADAVTVAPRVNGYVQHVLVENNQDVRVGEPLLRIDPDDYASNVEQARSKISQAAAGADASRAIVLEQRAIIAQARAQLVATRARAGHDAAEARRYAPLAATGAEKQERLAQLQSAAVQSAADVRAQAAALLLQERRIASLQAQTRQGDAQVAGARAQFTSANAELGGTLIRAAISGRIGDSTVRAGQYVQAGTRLMSIVPLDQLYVTANFKETQLALLRTGQPAVIRVDALDRVEVRGWVASISPGTGARFSLIPPNNATGNFTKIVQRVPVKISLVGKKAARRLLVPGLSVTVSVDTSSARSDLDQLRRERDRVETIKVVQLVPARSSSQTRLVAHAPTPSRRLLASIDARVIARDLDPASRVAALGKAR